MKLSASCHNKITTTGVFFYEKPDIRLFFAHEALTYLTGSTKFSLPSGKRRRVGRNCNLECRRLQDHRRISGRIRWVRYGVSDCRFGNAGKRNNITGVSCLYSDPLQPDACKNPVNTILTKKLMFVKKN